MPEFKKGKDLKKWRSPRVLADAGRLRIVGGKFGGRQIGYSGDPVTRPMKDDIREAVFNLVGGWVPGKAAFDLFAGTGAMGLEAISRGATQAFLIERHFPTVKIIRENVAGLDPEMAVQISASDTFFWSRKFLKSSDLWPVQPWIIFCCPPYDLYVHKTDELMTLVEAMLEAAPMESLMVVESDSRFDLKRLPQHEDWSVRRYSPAVVSVFKKFSSEAVAEP